MATNPMATNKAGCDLGERTIVLHQANAALDPGRDEESIAVRRGAIQVAELNIGVNVVLPQIV